MSIQIFLEGKLLGIDEFLLAPAVGDTDQVFLGRSHWISLLSEVLPRALLDELGLAKILLGSSGGGGTKSVIAQGRVARERKRFRRSSEGKNVLALADQHAPRMFRRPAGRFGVTEPAGEISKIFVRRRGLRFRGVQ
jgi:hypothetical protein